MNSCIVVADFGGYQKHCFETLKLRAGMYICKIDVEQLLDLIMEELKNSPKGPTVIVMSTPYFEGEKNELHPWCTNNSCEKLIRQYFRDVIYVFFQEQYDYFGREIFF